MIKVFPICYFPPVHWYAAATRHQEIQLEVWQPYRKQRFTSRMHILASNRVLPLTLPIERRNTRASIKDKKISYAEAWQRQHWRSLQASYQNSPFFEYYEDRIRPLFSHRYEWLVDLLMATTEATNAMLGWDGTVSMTKALTPEGEGIIDFRKDFDASRRVWPTWFMPTPYPQVFSGFHPGLSCLDLLFNEGPQAMAVLNTCFQEKDK